MCEITYFREKKYLSSVYYFYIQPSPQITPQFIKNVLL
jgi:hypothetical protein